MYILVPEPGCLKQRRLAGHEMLGPVMALEISEPSSPGTAAWFDQGVEVAVSSASGGDVRTIVMKSWETEYK